MIRSQNALNSGLSFTGMQASRRRPPDGNTKSQRKASGLILAAIGKRNDRRGQESGLRMRVIQCALTAQNSRK
eukprot:scaffold395845_cov14-Prasinocladus_malaysianus.AAC.1